MLNFFGFKFNIYLYFINIYFARQSSEISPFHQKKPNNRKTEDHTPDVWSSLCL